MVKVSRAFAGETVQDDLIGTLLRAALEETGAQRGLLLLSRSGQCRVAGEAKRRRETIVVRLRDEAVTQSLVPESVLCHIQSTCESVVIDGAADAYVHQHKPGSILCLPLVHQAAVVGALLLESRLASGVFTPARITVLKLMSSLAANALENSRLCGDLQERETRIRRLVDANIIGIFIVDIRGPILESNDAYLRMLGYERADLVSGRLRWTELTPPEWHAADKLRVERVKRVGRVLPFEKEFFRKDGTRVPVLMGVARFKEPRNQAVVFAHDMSQQKQAAAMALEARSIEDELNARRLYDTLLQNFQAMIFRFQAARNLISRHPDEAMRSLDAAINDGEQALDDSRNAIQALRSERIA
jgi:PAS domain S-box-containing protein